MPIYNLNNIKILYYDRVDISERIDINQTIISKERDICHYWHFLYYSFKFQSSISNGCYDDLLIMSMILSNIDIFKH